jgi:hypothetical protein
LIVVSQLCSSMWQVVLPGARSSHDVMRRCPRDSATYSRN